MKTYQFRGKRRRKANVLIKAVRAMLKEKYSAYYTPIPNYPLGSVQPEGEHLIGKDYRPELISKPKQG